MLEQHSLKYILSVKRSMENKLSTTVTPQSQLQNIISHPFCCLKFKDISKKVTSRLKISKNFSILPVTTQRRNSDSNSTTVRGYPPDWVLRLKQPLYTHSTDKLVADFHCLELNKVLKSRGNPVGLKILTVIWLLRSNVPKSYHKNN